MRKISTKGLVHYALAPKHVEGVRTLTPSERNNYVVTNDEAYPDGFAQRVTTYFIDGIEFYTYAISNQLGYRTYRIILKEDEISRVLFLLLVRARNRRHAHKNNSEYGDVSFSQFVDELYINADTKESIKNSFRVFLSMMSVPKSLEMRKTSTVVFHGEPGDAKTYNARKIFDYITSYCDLPKVETNIMEFAKKSAPDADYGILIDDVNIPLFHKGDDNGAIKSAILQSMDSREVNRLFIMTTNDRLDSTTIDPAFFRPGRIEHVVNFDHPDRHTKTRFLTDSFEKMVKHKDLFKIVTPEVIRAICDTASGAEFTYANLVQFRNCIVSNIMEHNQIGNLYKIAEESSNLQPESEQ